MATENDPDGPNKPRSPLRIVDYLIFGTPAVVFGFLWLIIEITDWVQPLMLAAYHVTIDQKTGTYTGDVSMVLPLLIVVLCYLVLVGFGYAIKMRTKNAVLKEIVRGIGPLEARVAALRDVEVKARVEVDGMILAVDQVVNRLYSIDKPRWRFTKVIGKYVIDAEGTATVEMLYDIEAGPEAAHVWKFDILADESAKAIEWLDELDLKVESLDIMDGKHVSYLPFRSSPKSKKIAIFFLPEIRQGDKRKVKITYRWPGLAADLLGANKTVFEHTFKTCDPLDCAEVSYTYLFAQELGKLDIHPLSIHSAMGTPNKIADPTSTMTGWQFHHDKLPMDNLKIAFAVSRTNGAHP